MAEIDDVATWLIANQDKKGSPEYGERLARLRELHTAPAAAPPDPNTWPGMVATKSPEDIRAGITTTFDPGVRRDKAYTDWANAVVAAEPSGADSRIRAFSRGFQPWGSYADQLNAISYGVGNKLGLTDKTYDEVLAYNRARDRAFERTNPTEDLSLRFGGNIASPYLRGAGMARNVGYNTLVGGLTGAGEAAPGEELKSAATNAAISGFGSALWGPTGAYVDRYRRSNVTPEVVDAANRLGVNVPYFVRAADPIAQAEGRRTAQTRVGSPASLGFENMQQGYGRAGEGIVQRTTGAPPATAPYTAGQAIEPAMEQAGRGATSAMGTIAQQTEALLPPGVRGDPAQLRQIVQNIIDLRTQAGHPNPAAGLEQTVNLATQPGGATWPGLSRYATEVGDTIGERTLTPGPVPRRDLRNLYAGVQADRANIAEQAGGLPARTAFEQGTAQQAELAQLRAQIEAAIGNRTPEQLINLVQNAASTRGGPTNLNQLALVLQNMSPAERQMVGGGVLGNIITRGQIQGPAGMTTNPGAVAKGISSMTPQGSAGLFPPGTPLGQDVDAMRVLGERIAAVDRFAGRGSAASLGERMAMPTAGVGGGVLGGIAQAAHMPPQVTWPMIALAAANLAGQGIKHLTQPRLAQYGAPNWVVEPVNRVGYGAARTAADYFTPRGQ